jgi:hypothetical protein
MIQLNKVIINGVYGDNYAALFYLIAQAINLPLFKYKKKCFITQPIKKRNNNAIKHVVK